MLIAANPFNHAGLGDLLMIEWNDFSPCRPHSAATLNTARTPALPGFLVSGTFVLNQNNLEFVGMADGIAARCRLLCLSIPPSS